MNTAGRLLLAARRPAVFVATTAAAAVLSVTVAFASPPTGLFSLRDHARATVAEAGTVKMPAGTDAVSASYTLAPGADSGWRTERGASVFAVTKGTLTLHAADGCTTKEYPVGQAALVRAGRYLVHNAGGEPLEFAAVFLNLKPGGPKPLVGGTGEVAPARCKGVSGYVAGRTPSGVAAADDVRGTFVGATGYGHSAHGAAADVIAVAANSDVFITSYVLEPGPAAAGSPTHRSSRS